MANSTFGRIV